MTKIYVLKKGISGGFLMWHGFFLERMYPIDLNIDLYFYIWNVDACKLSSEEDFPVTGKSLYNNFSLKETHYY